MSKSLEDIVVINDLHIPFHSKKSLKTMYKYIKETKPNKIFMLGDIIDFYSISRFDKSPSRKLNLQKEINTFKEVMTELRSIYKGEIWYLRGNHEDRLIKYIIRNAKELYWIEELNIKKLLDLDHFNIKYVDKRWFNYRGIMYSHIDKSNAYGGFTAKNIGQKVLTSVIHGHSHKTGKVRFKDKTFIDNGCLCELQAEYLESPSDWTHAFTVVRHRKDRTYIEQYDLVKGKFYYNGKEYK